MPEPASSLVRGMVGAGLALEGQLADRWCVVDSDDADVRIIDAAVGSGGASVRALVRLPARPPIQIRLPWPLRSPELFAALNGVVELLGRHTESLCDSGAEGPTAFALVEAWAAALLQGDRRCMLRSEGIDLLHIDLDTDTCLAPPEFVGAGSTLVDPWRLAACLCESQPVIHPGEPPRTDWHRMGSASAFLWALAGLSTSEGASQLALAATQLRLTAWPSLIDKGPASWGQIARTLSEEPMPASALFRLVPASAQERAFFINACLVTGCLELHSDPSKQLSGAATDLMES